MKHIINLATAPFCPNGLTVEEHVAGDPSFEWDPTKVALYLDEYQKFGVIKGTELRTKLKGTVVLNVNLLDHLLANPELIPDKWKGEVIFFWGTTYRDYDGKLHVRCLFWDGERWDSFYNCLDRGFGDISPALISA